HADDPARAGAVVDDEGHFPGLGKPRAQVSRDQVGAAARSVGYDRLDHAARVLRLRGCRRKPSAEKQQHRACNATATDLGSFAISMPRSAPISSSRLFAKGGKREQTFAAGGTVLNRGFGAVVVAFVALQAALAHAQDTRPARP